MFVPYCTCGHSHADHAGHCRASIRGHECECERFTAQPAELVAPEGEKPDDDN